jgi:hypothetical protein
LLDFMVRVSQDPSLSESLDDDPEGTLAGESELSDAAKDAVRSRSNGAVKAEINNELGEGAGNHPMTYVNHTTGGWTNGT